MEKKLQNYRKWIYACLGLFLGVVCILYLTEHVFGERIHFPDNSKGNAKYLEYAPDYTFQTGGIGCASIAMDNQKLFAAFYTSLYCLDLEKGQTEEIACPKDFFTIGDEDTKSGNLWNPTGVFYDPQEEQLYIANYHGSNVLVCTIRDDNSLEVINRISDADMVSPENVWVKNQKIAVADYDGNQLFLFDKSGKLEWKKEVGLAHGVTMSDNRIFVTSLLDRKVSCYDYNGKLIKETGKLGYEGTDSFMWPTAIEYYDKGRQLLITDAHTGRIYCYDEHLKYQSSIGGNGPSNNTFNFPYSTAIADNHIYVCDVFNGRILKLNLKGEIVCIYGDKIRGIPDDLVIHPYEDVPYSYGVLSDIDSKIFNPYMGAKVVSGYSGLFFQDHNGEIRKVDYSAYLQNGAYLERQTPELFQPYCTYVYDGLFEGKQYYVILSPQSDRQYLIYDVTDQICFLYSYQGVVKNEELCIWNVDGQWYSQIQIKKQFEEILEECKVYTDEFVKQVNAGHSRIDAYETVFLDYYNDRFWTSMTKEQFHEWIGKWFTSDAGQRFWSACEQGQKNIAKEAQTYFRQTAEQENTTYLCETLFVQMFGKG